MKTILFLEGGKDNDHQEVFDLLVERGHKVSIITDLHSNPGQLKRLSRLNPDCLFIGTTGMHADGNAVLKEAFVELKWNPKNVMFANERSLMAFLNIAKALKFLGTKFWEAPSTIPFMKDDPLEEIDWI